ncbi:NVEALA domain-containing protein [Dysgonomonas reticulitermitis]
MKKKIIGSLFIIVISGVIAFNVSFNLRQKSDPSILVLANIEALAQNEKGEGWDENKNETTSSMNGTVYKKSVIITCSIGGPLTSCTPSCRYQVKNSNGTWTSWMPC